MLPRHAPHRVPARAATTTLNRMALSQRHRGTTAGTRTTAAETPPARHSGAGRNQKTRLLPHHAPHRVPACAGTTTLNRMAPLQRHRGTTPEPVQPPPKPRPPAPSFPRRRPEPEQPPENIRRTSVAAPCAAWVPACAATTTLNRVKAFCSDIAAPPPEPRQPPPNPPLVIPAQAGSGIPRVLPRHALALVPACAGTTTLNPVVTFPATSRHHNWIRPAAGYDDQWMHCRPPRQRFGSRLLVLLARRSPGPDRYACVISRPFTPNDAFNGGSDGHDRSDSQQLQRYLADGQQDRRRPLRVAPGGKRSPRARPPRGLHALAGALFEALEGRTPPARRASPTTPCSVRSARDFANSATNCPTTARPRAAIDRGARLEEISEAAQGRPDLACGDADGSRTRAVKG